MADEEKNEQTPEAEVTPEESPETDAAEEQEPKAEEKPAEEAPAEEAPAEDEAAAEEEAPAEGAPAEEEPAEDAPAGGADELEGLDWKARGRLERSRESGPAGPQRSTEERASERGDHRRAAAKARSAHRRRRREKHQAGQGTPPAERSSAGRKERRGIVTSNRSDKTITVRIDVARRHPAYEKIVRQSSTLRAHDEGNEANEGDLVRIVETRPLSRSKRWRLIEVLEKAE